MLLEEKMFLPAEFLGKHEQLPVILDHLHRTLAEHGRKLTRVDVARVRPKDAPRIDPANFEVYRLNVYSHEVLPIMQIDVAVTERLMDIDAATSERVAYDNFYFQTAHNPTSRKERVPLGFQAENIALLVDSSLQSSAIARDFVRGVNNETGAYAIDYKRNRVREAIEHALLGQRVVSLERFGEVYSSGSDFGYSPPPLQVRKGYGAEFFQGTGLKWAIETDMDGKVIDVIIEDSAGIIDPMLINQKTVLDPRLLSKPLHKTSAPPGFSMYSEEHRRLVSEVKKVITVSGRLLGHSYDAGHIDALVSPSMSKLYALIGGPRITSDVNWTYTKSRH